MTRAVSFQTRARTIDHLGRGQIADAPTAISELWKNAYDAYAKNVGLHIFAGEPTVAAVLDDGVGMNEQDVLDRWLVIGTESKIGASAIPSETLGLSERSRQGEKGIGRLSAAFLAPATVLLTKKGGAPFVAVLVDWRLFENPFLDLSDVQLPVETFATAEEVLPGLRRMVATLTANLGSGSNARGDRLRAAWTRYDEHEAELALPATSAIIKDAWADFPLTERQLNEWPTFVGLRDHGTAMFLVDVGRDLAAWVDTDQAPGDVEEVQRNLRQTLTGFTDPFANPRPDFDYEVWIHHEVGRNRREIAADAVFGTADLHGLEHWVEGEFDSDGVFTGRVVAFGRDQGVQQFRPREPVARSARDRLGPFRFCIGTFEQDLRRSTHDEQTHVKLGEQAERFGGINIYRDDLRVMPYGREEADFLGIEAQRGRHAGRYFWAHRRSFGRIAFTRKANPNLRDKAGREGLVDNRARRHLKRIVAELLVEFAARFFGSDASLRQELMPEIMARNAAAKAAAVTARTNRRKTIRQFLRDQKQPLDDALQRVEALAALAETVRRTGDVVEATVLQSRLREMLGARDGLRPPIVQKLGDLEEDYREYRDGYRVFTERLEELDQLAAEVEAEVGSISPVEAATESFAAQERILGERLERYDGDIRGQLSELGKQWAETVAADRGEFRRRYGHLVPQSLEASNLLPLVNLIGAGRAEVEEAFSGRYIPFINALRQLHAGIDLDSAFAATEDDRAELEDRLRDLQTVAQVGVTVEIIGHELETLEGEVRRNLDKLPKEVRELPAFRAALTSHQALADRLRFLAPMKVAGYRARETISGSQIAEYVHEFFDRLFSQHRIEFIATETFRAIRVVDIPARIYPVFLNLVNNAIYWVAQEAERKIRIDFVEGKVVVADSGPGVDPDDAERIFELFFTRRRFGRGVGLYLSRANLAVAGHRIRYATKSDPKVLSGANFIIEFRGVTTDE